VFGTGRDGHVVVHAGEVKRVYRDIDAESITIHGTLQNPDGYRLRARDNITLGPNGFLDTRQVSSKGYQPGIGGYSGQQQGSPPTEGGGGGGCTSPLYGIGGRNTSTVQRCVEWSYWLRVPLFLDLATPVSPGGLFVTRGGAAGGGDSQWELFYNRTYCEANNWEFCGGPGGESGGLLYAASPAIHNGTWNAQGGNGTQSSIGGYGGGGGGGGIIVLVTGAAPATPVQLLVDGGASGQDGIDIYSNVSARLNQSAPGTTGTTITLPFLM
jgi:hypothetical protein